MIRFINDARCWACDDKITDKASGGFELHEVARDRWEILCVSCCLVLDLDWGK